MKPLTLALGLVLLAAPVRSQPYDLSWYTVDGGGATSTTGGAFTLDGTIGQPDAGGPHTGDVFSLNGGFWLPEAPPTGSQADLAASKTDGQATAVPGQPITYTIVVENLGPDPVTGATVTDTVPPTLTGVSWTCAGAGGGACTASGAGSIADAVDLPVGATVTYALTGTISPAASGSLSNTVSVTPPGGTVDPFPGNNSATDTDTLAPETDLSITKSDGQTAAVPGQPLTYTIVVGNGGPSDASGATVTDTVPPALLGATWTCVPSGGASCTPSGSGSISDTVAIPVGAAVTYSLTGTVDPLATGTLVNTATVAPGAGATDPAPGNNSATDVDTLVAQGEAEMSHGVRLVLDLASSGGAPDVDLFRMRQEPFASYEIVVDEASGDIGRNGPVLERLAADGSTVLQSSLPVGAGFARSLRWANTGGTAIDDQTVRVRSAGCTTDCGPDDTYRIRAYETTTSIPRFNNSGSQITVLLLQNTMSEPIDGTVYFWSTAGGLVGQQPFSLEPKELLVLNTAAAVPGVGGSITVAHNGRYASLAGKTVALEPATGFSFDSPMVERAR